MESDHALSTVISHMDSSYNWVQTSINILGLRQNRWYFADNIFKFFYLNWKLYLNKILLKYVSKGLIYKTLKIGSDYGLVPSKIKPQPESLLIQFYDTTWHHPTSVS